MAEFRTPVDVANRALQHCGIPRITAFTDDSKGASEVSFSYDKVRQAELRRNAWRFAIRKVALRAIDWNTMFLVPATYVAAATYPIGAIVKYQDVVYFSTAPVPVNTPPDANPGLWTVYFGPLAVVPWAPQADPSAPPLWNALQNYALGALVTTPNGTIWECIQDQEPLLDSNGNVLLDSNGNVLYGTGNAGQNPSLTDGVFWVVIGHSSSTNGYYAGELVYVLVDGVVKVFMSLQSGNVDDPTDIKPWDATTTYFKDDTVSTPPAEVFFDGTLTTFNGETVFFTAALFQSTIDLNINNEPGQSAAWEEVPPTQIDVMAGQNWLQLDATIVHQRVNYPIQAGPRNQATTRNVFRLPSGYLKTAPQDPKQGIVSYLGVPSGLPYDDWVLEGNWLVSRDQDVIILRFVADIADVTLMDPMFCEGLGARVGLEICESLTQSDAKLGTIAQAYRMFMGEARAVNGIETGTAEPPLDDYISCRL